MSLPGAVFAPVELGKFMHIPHVTSILNFFFDQVVLGEHFRCAPEIIDFSNSQFYDGRLVPLRLPTKLERLNPSLIDVRVTNGEKNGKVNEREADKIVDMIKKTMEMQDSELSPRSIGVISLIGDEQSRLIRGRLLDAVGPELLAKHNVLVGLTTSGW